MSQMVFNPMQLDAIGEVMNISLGSSATAVSNLLNKRVDITTPKVKVVALEDFSLGELEPAIGVEIKYVSGLEGSNIMLLKRGDVKVILDILMGMETPEEEFEMNELTVSAVCEVMNQMMGAASTALSTFLGRPVNISTPQSFTLDDVAQFKEEHFHHMGSPLVVVNFILDIEDALQSEFVNVMSVELARELLAGFGMGLEEMDAMEESTPAPEPAPAPAPEPAASGGGGGKLSQEEIERLMGQMADEPAPEPEPAPAAAGGGGKLSQEEIERLMGQMADEPASEPEPAPAAAGGGGKLSQDEIERLMGQMAEPAPAQPAAQTPPPVQSAPAAQAPVQQPAAQQPVQQPVMQQQPVQQAPVMQQPVQQQPVMQAQPVYQPVYQPEPKLINSQPVPFSFASAAERLGKEQAENLELIMSVPLEVSVEIGRTTRKVEEILTYSKGSLVVLDKLAGDQVDLFVNGMCVARGDVVVIDDNFGIRITEIVKKPGLMDLAAK